MKKFITLCLLAFVAIAVNAQFGSAALNTDTSHWIINTGTSTKYIKATAGYNSMGVQFVVTKVSGTVAAGTILCYASLDGVNYTRLASTDSMNIATTNMSKILSWTNTPYVYYKFIATGSGTEALTWKLYYTLRKNAILTTP